MAFIPVNEADCADADEARTSNAIALATMVTMCTPTQMSTSAMPNKGARAPPDGRVELAGTVK